MAVTRLSTTDFVFDLVFVAGHHVVHRAAPLLEPAERITFVNSFVPRASSHEASKPKILRAVDDEAVVAAEVFHKKTKI